MVAISTSLFCKETLKIIKAVAKNYLVIVEIQNF